MSKKQKKKNGALPEEIEDIRTRVSVGRQAPTNTSSVEAADAFKSLGYDNSLIMEDFKKDLKIQIVELSDEMIMFDLIGVDAAVANAFRRILLSELPSMAIEKVRIFQNTSIIQDEVLAHRLGLVPIKADPRMFKFVEEGKGTPNELNTVVFTLDIGCTRNTQAPSSAPANEQFTNSTIYSSELKWIPQGKQAERFASNPIKPVLDDIILAKMRPGQSLEIECHAVKGIGQTHAKWSPVATASYRLLPEVTLEQPVKGALAEELVATCPMKVFDIEDIGGTMQAKVARPRNCTMCRECIRKDGWQDRVTLSRVRDHFMFSVESTGVYTPTELFRECVKVLAEKCKTVLAELDA